MQEPKENSINEEESKKELNFTNQAKVPQSMNGRAATQTPYRTDLNFKTGSSKLEAKDFTDKWYSATVVETDYNEGEVLIHFDKWSSRFDEWIPMDSPRLRSLQTPIVKEPKIKEFLVGEKILATWVDGKKYPATVRSIIDTDKYDVLFDDGYAKILKKSKMTKITSRTFVPNTSPSVDNYLGSKQERRDKKRKHKVSDLFFRHSKKKAKSESEKKPENPDPDLKMNSVKSDSNDAVQIEITTSVNIFKGLEGANKIKSNLKRLKKTYDNSLPQWIVKNLSENESCTFEEETGINSRRALIIPDPKLPEGWAKHIVQRKTGNSAGKWDVLFVHKLTGKKFRSRNDIKTFMESQGLFNFDPNIFDFCVHPSKNKYSRTKNDDYHSKKIKTLLPKVKNNPLITETSSYTNPENIGTTSCSNNTPITENCNDNATFIGDLRVEIKDSTFKCPKEGCNKNFRKENLLQMHIKHYHPEYSKFVGSTPNVADLAYARTIGEPVTEIIPKKSKTIISQNFHGVIPTITSTNSDIDQNTSEIKDASLISFNKSDKYAETTDNTLNVEDFSTDRTNNCNMSPGTLFDLRHGEDRVHTGIKTLPPMKLVTDSDQVPYYDINSKSKKIKMLDHEQDLDNIDDSLSYIDENSDFSYKCNNSRMEALSDDNAQKQSDLPSTMSNGEPIKYEKLRREEIINCTCGLKEEDGLMIQCDLCLCWQHGYCNSIEKESDVPEKYVCYICQHPLRQRSSKKYFHDQDWIREGKLMSLNNSTKDNLKVNMRTAKLKRSYDLISNLLQTQNILHSLRVKLNVAQNKNHPKLYLWAKNWSKIETPKLPTSPIPIINIVKNNLDEHQINAEEKLDFIKNELDQKSITSDTELMKILEEDSNVEEAKIALKSSSPKEENSKFLDTHANNDEANLTKQEEIPLVANNETTLKTLLPLFRQSMNDDRAFASSQVSSNGLKASSVIQPIIPEPEAPIDPIECKLRLLEHIEDCQMYIDSLLNFIEIEISALEDMENSTDTKKLGNKEIDYKQTIRMLLNDLESIRKMSALC